MRSSTVMRRRTIETSQATRAETSLTRHSGQRSKLVIEVLSFVIDTCAYQACLRNQLSSSFIEKTRMRLRRRS
jgi:hypothetical protein